MEDKARAEVQDRVFYFIFYKPVLSARYALNQRLQHKDGVRKTPRPPQHSINVINIPPKQIVHKLPV